MAAEVMYTCPCCGYKTLDQKPPGTFVICEVCDWEDDMVQFHDPDYEGGANGYSLRQFQHRYANGYKAKYRVPSFDKDPDWAILSPEIDSKTNKEPDFFVSTNGETKGT